MKKMLYLLGVLVILFSTEIKAVESVGAMLNTKPLKVNDTYERVAGYTIGNTNYYKLRDIAYVLKGTANQFEVSWDGVEGKILIQSNTPYTIQGNELTQGNQEENETAIPLTSTLKVDGELVTIEGYTIEGSSYVSLRSLGQLIGFEVIWNENLGEIQIQTTTHQDQTITPWKYQSMLGRGLDVNWSRDREDRRYYSKKALEDYKEMGVSHVRIRLDHVMSEEQFQKLDKQIEDCLEVGIIPVVAYRGDDFKIDPSDKNIQEIVKWWGEVATRYQDMPHLVSFNILIESTDALNKQPEALNKMYEQVVTEIRKTNPTRIIMISPRLRSDPSYLHELVIPSAHNNYLMAEWHFYASGPDKEIGSTKQWTTGTKEEKKLIQDKIAHAVKWQEKTGIPTWVGAWMPGNFNKGDTYTVEEQMVFADFMIGELEKAHIPWAVNADDQYYNHETYSWYIEMLPLVKLMFNNYFVK